MLDYPSDVFQNSIGRLNVLFSYKIFLDSMSKLCCQKVPFETLRNDSFLEPLFEKYLHPMISYVQINATPEKEISTALTKKSK